MLNIENWIADFTDKIQRVFPDRIYFIGLQGSHARGEATERSDIDTVVILDELNAEDLAVYRKMIQSLPNRSSVCGFISGKSELMRWEPSELFQFCHDTTPIKGSLEFLLDEIDREDVKRAIRIGACNIYHTCVHNFIHDRSDDILRSAYKSAAFLIQAILFYRFDKYYKTQIEMQSVADKRERAILEIGRNLKTNGIVEFEPHSAMLFEWVKDVLINL